MTLPQEIRTDRLRLRRWLLSDRIARTALADARLQPAAAGATISRRG
jgi:hypothetical protein